MIRRRRGYWLLGVLLFNWTGSGSARAETRQPSLSPANGVALGLPQQSPSVRYQEQLVARARALGLARSTLWLRLGHWRKNTFSGYTSEADGEGFFLSSRGREDPQAELTATLRAFFQPPPARVPPEGAAHRGELHPRCRFPARYDWLKARLGMDEARLPPVSCPGYREFLEILQPAGITLVFSSYYLNNPASAFGHTFLRIRKDGPRQPGDGRELLDYGIDFAANVDTSNPILYAFKGLTGLFPGTFSKMPYYVKVREYNDFESRDLWEYDLKLTQEQVDRVVAHIWELGSTYFAYYYTTENCSYHVLGALEVASSQLSLLEHLGWPIIPADTVKALRYNPGLIDSVSYRPSNRTAFRQRLGSLDGDEQHALVGLMREPHSALPRAWSVERQARVLDVALDLADFQYARDLVVDLEERDPDGVELQLSLLRRRAKLGVVSVPPEFAPPFRQQPLLGHDSARLGLGPGYSPTHGFFHELSWRAALHDLGDPSVGYPEGAAIEFMPIELRYYAERGRMEFTEGSLVRITSLSPLTSFIRQLSWRVDVGAERVHDAGCDGCLMGFGALGGGVAADLLPETLTVFLLAEARAGVPVDGGLLGFGRGAVGPWGGVRLSASPSLTLLTLGRWSWLPHQRPVSTWEAKGSLRWGYRRNMALGVEGALEPRYRGAQVISYLYF